MIKLNNKTFLKVIKITLITIYLIMFIGGIITVLINIDEISF